MTIIENMDEIIRDYVSSMYDCVDNPNAWYSSDEMITKEMAWVMYYCDWKDYLMD